MRRVVWLLVLAATVAVAGEAISLGEYRGRRAALPLREVKYAAEKVTEGISEDVYRNGCATRPRKRAACHRVDGTGA